MPEAEIIPIDGRSQSDPNRCLARTRDGKRCKRQSVGLSGFCRTHGGREETRAEATEKARRRTARARVEESSTDPVERLRNFFERRLAGSYAIDDFGFDEELYRDILMPIARPLYEDYFRVKTIGMDRIPSDGPALLVGNHSGTIPLDAVMLQHAVASEHPEHRVIRNTGANLVWTMPFISSLARKSGNAVACDEDAFELLRRGELVGVFPEGFKGVGKGWKNRYRLQRFGRGGFIEVALRSKVPIIPVAIVGAEETYPMIADVRPLARALGFPYFPVTPTFPLLGPLGLIPLPSKWVIEFGEPIAMDDYPDDAADDAMLIFDLTDSIRDTIQQMLITNLRSRKGTFG